MSAKTQFTDQEKAIVQYFKDKLIARGVEKFARDWHLRQLSIARNMLAGDKAPSFEEWKRCIDWCFNHKFWGDKVDHLARVEALWAQHCMHAGRKKDLPVNTEGSEDKFSLINWGV